MVKLQKIKYLESKKSFSDEIKSFLIVFEGLSFGKKIKIVDTGCKVTSY